MLALAAVFLVVFITYLLSAVLDRIDQRADETQLLLDGIIDRLNKLDRHNYIERNK